VPAIYTAPTDPIVWVDELFGEGWMVSGPFVDYVGADETNSWEMTSNWPFEL
jgi:hypothetical protein